MRTKFFGSFSYFLAIIIYIFINIELTMERAELNYKKTFEELERAASKFWPSELSGIEAKLSILPLLLKTQDQFISIISVKCISDSSSKPHRRGHFHPVNAMICTKPRKSLFVTHA